MPSRVRTVDVEGVLRHGDEHAAVGARLRVHAVGDYAVAEDLQTALLSTAAHDALAQQHRAATSRSQDRGGGVHVACCALAAGVVREGGARSVRSVWGGVRRVVGACCPSSSC
jgi:hypothetical protein